MYTRCPDCEAVFELEARHLAQAAGVVRCGSCHKVFNALGQLFGRSPHSSETLPETSGGMPPVLDSAVQGTLEFDDRSPDPEYEPAPKVVLDLPDYEPESASESGPWRWFWPGISAALLLALTVHWLFLPDNARQTVLGWIGAGGEQPLGDPTEALLIVSRDMHPHPGLENALIISMTLSNPASQPVAYPLLEVRLYDASQQLVGVRRFEPDEYLSDQTEIDSGLRSGLLLPVLLEIASPGGQPEGFEIRFH